MATRPQLVRNKPFMTIVGVAAASLVGYVMWGPVAGASIGVLALIGVAIYTLRHRREDHLRASDDDFSFAEVAVRMRAKDKAHDLMLAKRATAALKPVGAGSA